MEWYTLTAEALGAAAGFFLPGWAEKICWNKMTEKGKSLPENSRYTAPWVKLLCLVLNAAGWGGCWHLAAGPVTAAAAMAMWSVSIVLFLIDFRVRLLPNMLLGPLFLLGVLLQGVTNGPMGLLRGLICMAAVMAVFLALGSVMGLSSAVGAGDVKLAGVMGMALGYPAVLPGIAIMTAILLIFCLAGLALKKITLKSMIPFGPFLLPGLMGGILWLLWSI